MGYVETRLNVNGKIVMISVSFKSCDISTFLKKHTKKTKYSYFIIKIVTFNIISSNSVRQN